MDSNGVRIMLHLRRRALRHFRDRSSPSLGHQFQPDFRRRTGGQNSVGDGGARGAERGIVVGIYRRHPGVVVCVPVGDSRWPHLVAQNSCALGTPSSGFTVSRLRSDRNRWCRHGMGERLIGRAAIIDYCGVVVVRPPIEVATSLSPRDWRGASTSTDSIISIGRSPRRGASAGDPAAIPIEPASGRRSSAA